MPPPATSPIWTGFLVDANDKSTFSAGWKQFAGLVHGSCDTAVVPGVVSAGALKNWLRWWQTLASSDWSQEKINLGKWGAIKSVQEGWLLQACRRGYLSFVLLLWVLLSYRWTGNRLLCSLVVLPRDLFCTGNLLATISHRNIIIS